MTNLEIIEFKEFKIEKLCLVGLVIMLVMLSLVVVAPEKITKQGYIQDLYEKCSVACGAPETCERLSEQGIWTLAMATELCKCMNEHEDLEYCCSKLHLECP